MPGLENLVSEINFSPDQQEHVDSMLSDINKSTEALGEISDELSDGTNLLTETEVELLDALSSGNKTADAAKKAGINPKTVRPHITEITSKLGVQSVEEAILKAFHHEKLPRWKGAPRHNLVARQEKMVRLAAQGMSYPEIGREVYLSPNTTQVFMSNIASKLGVSGRLAIIRAGLERGVDYGASDVDRRKAHIGALATSTYQLLNNDEQQGYVRRKARDYQYSPVIPKVKRAAAGSSAAEPKDLNAEVTEILESQVVSVLPQPSNGAPKSRNGAEEMPHETRVLIKPERVADIRLPRLPKVDNEALESLSKGVSDAKEAEAVLADLRTEFGARTNGHLIRKVINEKYGRLPYKEIFGYELETKEDLQVLQYLSFGATIDDIAFLLDTKGKKKTPSEAKIVINKIVKALGAVDMDHAVYLGFEKGYLGSEDPSFILQREGEVLKAAEKRPLSDEDE